jgi:hypothetical protein
LANSIYCTVASWDARNIEHKNKLAVIDTTWCSKHSTKCSQKTDSKIVIHLKYTITCEKCSCSWISICVCVFDCPLTSSVYVEVRHCSGSFLPRARKISKSNVFVN